MTLEAEHRNARASSLEKIAEAVEQELAVLREARPHLESRIDRAAGLLVVQLSSGPRTRPIRCRIRKDGKRVYLVASLSAGGVTYLVDPIGWNCSCPDHQRRDAMCKHVAASWVLWKADRPRRAACADCKESFHPDRLLEVQEGQAEETLNPGQKVCRVCAPRHGLPVPKQRGCEACEGGWVRVGEEIVDSETGEVTTAFNTVRCRNCAPVEPHHLTDEEMREWMASVRWIYAKTMPDHPHEYTLKREQDPVRFAAVARTIWECGYDRHYLRRPWRTLIVGDYICWVWTRPEGPRHSFPEQDTILVNRAHRHQGRVA